MTALNRLTLKFGFSSRRPVLLELRSSTWFITAMVSTAIFTDIWLYSVIVPVFPFSLSARAGVAADQVQHWLSVLLAVYSAALLVGSPVCGVLADRITYRKAPLLIGLVIMAGSTVMLCVAKGLPLLIVGRLLQGLSAGVIWVVGLALLADTVGKRDIAKALGYTSMGLSVAQVVAPLLGGIVYERSGYYAVFAMSFGVIVVDVFLRLSVVEKKQARQWLDPDESHDRGPVSDVAHGPRVLPPSALAAAAEDPEKTRGHDQGSLSTMAHTTNEATPLRNRLPPILSLWMSARMLAAFAGSFAFATQFSALDTTLTLFASRTFGYSSLQAGLLFLPLLLPFLFSPIYGSFVDKYGSRWFAVGGFLCMVPSWVLFRLVDHDSPRQVVLCCALLTLIGLSNAVAMAALTAEFSKICDAKEAENPGLYGVNGAYAQAYSIYIMAWAAGSLVGAFWSGGVYNTAGWATMSWTFALLAGVMVVPTLLFTDGWIGHDSRRQ